MPNSPESLVGRSVASVPPSPQRNASHVKETEVDEFEFVFAKIRRLSEQVSSMDTQHMNLDARMVIIDSQLQALAEEQDVQNCKILQLTLAQGSFADDPSPSSVAGQSTAISNQQEGVHVVGHASDVSSRILALERGQRTLASAVQRSMKLALNFDTAQKAQPGYITHRQNSNISECSFNPESNPASLVQEVREQLEKRHAEQEQCYRELVLLLREQKISCESMEKRLADQERQLSDLDSAVGDVQSTAMAHALFGGTGVSVAKTEIAHREDFATPQRLEKLSTSLKIQGDVVLDLQKQVREMRRLIQSQKPSSNYEASEMALLSSSIVEIRQRLDALVQLADDQVTPCSELVTELQRVSRCCTDGLSKADELELRLDHTCSRLDTHDQRFQTFTERVERVLTQMDLHNNNDGVVRGRSVEASSPPPKATDIAEASMKLLMRSPAAEQSSQTLQDLCARLRIPMNDKVVVVDTQRLTPRSSHPMCWPARDGGTGPKTLPSPRTAANNQSDEQVRSKSDTPHESFDDTSPVEPVERSPPRSQPALRLGQQQLLEATKKEPPATACAADATVKGRALSPESFKDALEATGGRVGIDYVAAGRAALEAAELGSDELFLPRS